MSDDRDAFRTTDDVRAFLNSTIPPPEGAFWRVKPSGRGVWSGILAETEGRQRSFLGAATVLTRDGSQYRFAGWHDFDVVVAVLERRLQRGESMEPSDVYEEVEARRTST